jgi:hypothetical protein
MRNQETCRFLEIIVLQDSLQNDRETYCFLRVCNNYNKDSNCPYCCQAIYTHCHDVQDAGETNLLELCANSGVVERVGAYEVGPLADYVAIVLG